MCIANHPVLYDLHMQALEQSCVRTSQVAAIAAVAGEAQPSPEEDRGYGLPGLVVTWLAAALRRVAPKGWVGQTA